MTIEIKKANRYVGIWYTSSPGVDFLAVAWREPGDPKLHAMYRFRYYQDRLVFGSRDEKAGTR